MRFLIIEFFSRQDEMITFFVDNNGIELIEYIISGGGGGLVAAYGRRSNPTLLPIRVDLFVPHGYRTPRKFWVGYRHHKIPRLLDKGRFKEKKIGLIWEF